MGLLAEDTAAGLLTGLEDAVDCKILGTPLPWVLPTISTSSSEESQYVGLVFNLLSITLVPAPRGSGRHCSDSTHFRYRWAFASSGFIYYPGSLRANPVAISNTTISTSSLAAWRSDSILLLPPTVSLIISVSLFLRPVSCCLPLLYLTLILRFRLAWDLVSWISASIWSGGSSGGAIRIVGALVC